MDENGRVYFTRSYDREGRLLSYTENRNIRPVTYTYAYETRADGAIYPDARLVGLTCSDGVFRRHTETVYDALGRVSGRTATLGSGVAARTLGESFGYYGEGVSTTYVDAHTVTLGDAVYSDLRYAYDASGNVTEIWNAADDTVLRRYTYDLLDRLVRADCADLGKSYTYAYDEFGNLTEGKAYAYTLGELGEPTASDTYAYPGPNANPSYNQLLSFNGQSIVYDACGNPTTYRGKALSWEGRRLVNDGERAYVYKADGTRIKKGSTVYKTAGSRILTEEAPSHTMSFFYDEAGVCGLLYNGTTCYHYVKNLQGDIVALLDNSGNTVARYLYDPWGVPTVTNEAGTPITNPEHIGNLNPFRYRGYYYDVETGLYYLQSRYYDPALRRFLNADVMDVLTVDMMAVADKNLFAYCNGNPVMYSDPSGAWSSWATAGLAVGAVLCIAAVTILTCGVGTATLAGAVAVGAAKGALILGATGTIIGGGIGYAATGTTEGALEGAAIGFGIGAVAGAVAGGVNAYLNYSNAARFLTSQGADPKEILSAYKGTPKIKMLGSDTTVYRVWGGDAKRLGHWVSPQNYGSATRELLSLPPCNTMTNISSFLLPKGTTALVGRAAPLFEHSGGGIQWWIAVLG